MFKLTSATVKRQQLCCVVKFLSCNSRNLLIPADRPSAVTFRESGIEPRSYLDIPTPRQLPLFGTKLDFLMAGAGKKLHEYIDHRHQQLGPIFRESLGPTELVFVSSADGIRDMFKYEGRYPKHPVPESWTIYNEDHQCKRGLFFMDDEEWLTNRKVMNSLLMKNGSSQFNGPVQRACEDLCEEFGQRLSTTSNEFVEVPDLIESLYIWAVKGVVGVALGKAVLSDMKIQPLLKKFSQTLHKLFEHSAPLMSFPPSLAKRFGLRVWSQYDNTASEILAMANRLVELSISRKCTMDEQCLVTGMIESGMSKDVIQRIFADLIIAGGDTTAFTTQWALYLLAKNEREQRHVFNDMNRDLSNLESPLVRGTIRESMRLYPVAVFIGRPCAVDGIIENFTVPSQTMVLASLFTSGRDESSFPDANNFQPSRWSRQETGRYSAVICPSASVPYALGARSCVGQRLANIQMHFLISAMLQHFEIKLLNKRDIDIDIRMIPVPSEKIKLGIRRRIR